MVIDIITSLLEDAHTDRGTAGLTAMLTVDLN